MNPLMKETMDPRLIKALFLDAQPAISRYDIVSIPGEI